MNRILPIAILSLFFSLCANAQFNKNDILLGGQISYYNATSSSTGNTDTKSNNGIFTISAGKAIKENRVFGLNVSYLPRAMNNYYSTAGLLDYKSNGYSIGLFYRAYKSLGKDFYLFAEGSASYQGSTESGKDDTGAKVLTGSGNGGSIVIYPGISYKITKKFLLEISIPSLFSISYNSSQTTVPPNTSKNNQFYVSSTLSSNLLQSVGIGFRIIL
jgi:hypothetical protein